jgi:hypothetical protein
MHYTSIKINPPAIKLRHPGKAKQCFTAGACVNPQQYVSGNMVVPSSRADFNNAAISSLFNHRERGWTLAFC